MEKILMEPEDPKDLPCCCERCGCEKHKCPSRMVHCKYPSQIKSLYQQDFVQQAKGPEKDIYNVNKVREKVEHKMEAASTYKNTFTGYDIEKTHNKTKSRPTTASIPFCGSTSYQSDFMNWGAANVPPSNSLKKTYGMPFQGKSTYADSYIPPDLKARAQPMKAV